MFCSIDSHAEMEISFATIFLTPAISLAYLMLLSPVADKASRMEIPV